MAHQGIVLVLKVKVRGAVYQYKYEKVQDVNVPRRSRMKGNVMAKAQSNLNLGEPCY